MSADAVPGHRDHIPQALPAAETRQGRSSGPGPALGARVFSPPRLRAYRHRRALAQRALARLARVSTERVRAAEAGTHTPAGPVLARLATALECSPADLCAPEATACDNAQYWAVVAATAPPMTTRDIDSVGATLRRISGQDTAA